MDNESRTQRKIKTMSTTIEVKRDDKYGLRLLQRAAADEKSAADRKRP
jgi:hypothetical protein